jgi:hypothetical protein
MFNIRKGKISLDVSCIGDEVYMKLAPDDRSQAAGYHHFSLIGSNRKTALKCLKNHPSKDNEESLMAFFHKAGYLVSPVSSWVAYNDAGKIVNVYRLP